MPGAITRVPMPVRTIEVTMPGGITKLPISGWTMEESIRQDQGQAQHIILVAGA